MLVQFSVASGHTRIIYGCGQLPKAGTLAVYTCEDGSIIEAEVLASQLAPAGVWAGPQRISVDAQYPSPQPGSAICFTQLPAADLDLLPA